MRWRFSVVLLFSVLSLGGVCTGPQKPRREFQLQANSDDFSTLADRESKLSTVASGFGFTEGPVWDPAGFVIVSDEVSNKILHVYMDGTKEELVSVVDHDDTSYDVQQTIHD